MSAPRVPIELQELVVELVPNGDYRSFTTTLRSCALTCHAWLPLSRRRLYHFVVLWHARRTQLCKLLESIDTSSDLSTAIQKLRIGLAGSDADFPEATLLVLAGKLQRLTSLSVMGARICSSPVLLPVLAGFPSLTSLVLHSVVFTNYVAFRRMLVAASALRTLSLSDIGWASTYSTLRQLIGAPGFDFLPLPI